MTDDLERRLDAVERAITGGDRAVADLADAAELSDRVDTLGERADEVETRLADLEAAVRALRGYVGHEHDADQSSENGSPAHHDDTRRIDVDTGSEWPDGGRPAVDQTDTTTDRHGATADADTAARDERRSDPESESDSERNGPNRDHDRTADEERTQVTENGSVADDGTVAWNWGWATETQRGDTRHQETDATGQQRGVASEDRPPGDPGTNTGTAGQQNRRRQGDEPRAPTQQTAGRGDGETFTGPWPDELTEPSGREAVATDEHDETGPTAGERTDQTAGERTSPGRRESQRQSGCPDADQDAWDPSASVLADRWPGEQADPVDDRRPGASGEWPEGIDVERAQPWSVPDPPRVATDEGGEDDGLLERLREAL
jgi:hypothetical protein